MRKWVLLSTACLLRCGSGLVCGPNTQKEQLPNGDTACVPVAVTKGDTQCDADAGVMLVAGNKCVSVLKCGPGTALDPASGDCLPTGTGGAHVPPACPPPAAGKVCVNGTLRNFVDGSYLSSQTLRVAIYDPISFLGSPNPAPLGETQSTDTFVISGITAPGSGYVLVVTGDPTGAPAMYEQTGIGGIVQAGQVVRVDGYVITRAQVSSWSAMANANFDVNGSLIYRFFNDPPPPVNARTPTETHPVAGVQLIDLNNGSMPAAGAVYFGPMLTALDTTLTATSASGGVILAGAANASTGNYTGRGGGVTTWEAHQAQVVPHIIQIDFLHPM